MDRIINYYGKESGIKKQQVLMHQKVSEKVEVDLFSLKSDVVILDISNLQTVCIYLKKLSNMKVILRMYYLRNLI